MKKKIKEIKLEVPVKQEPNYWMYATIILGLLCLAIIVYQYAKEQGDINDGKILDLQGFKIANNTLNNFAKIMMDSNASSMQICMLKNGKDCIRIFPKNPNEGK